MNAADSDRDDDAGVIRRTSTPRALAGRRCLVVSIKPFDDDRFERGGLGFFSGQTPVELGDAGAFVVETAVVVGIPRIAGFGL